MKYLDIILSTLDNKYFVVGSFNDHVLVNQLELIPADEHEAYINEYVLPLMSIKDEHIEEDDYDLTGGFNVEVRIVENCVSKILCEYKSYESLEEIYNRQVTMNRNELHKIELTTGGFVYLDEEAWSHYDGQGNHYDINTGFVSSTLHFNTGL